ncbi:MAG: prolipoprotein diacylglyceryl transferase [Planctomycetaceae bacterium]|nr:prolipoprotein diacylglyceryl transferase [Planctomycetaceae bacterium]
MRQTLFYIPEQFLGLPVFGYGLALALLLVAAAVAAARHFVKVKKFDADIGYYTGLAITGSAILLFVVPNVIEPGHGFPIRGYGFFLLLAIISSLALILKITKHPNITTEQIFSLCLWAVISGIIGARLFYITEYWNTMYVPNDFRQTFFNIVNIANGGLVVFGSIIGGTIGSVVYLRRNKLPVLATFDMMAPAMFLGIAAGRLGCLMNGCCFGGVCDLPWAITFPQGSPAHIHQIEHNETFFDGIKLFSPGTDGAAVIKEVQPNSGAEKAGLKPKMIIQSIGAVINGRPENWTIHSPDEAITLIHSLRLNLPNENLRYGIITEDKDMKSFYVPFTPSKVLPVHPTQIYSSVVAALLCGVLLVLRRLKPFQRDGMIFCTFMLLYSVARFTIEMIRTDEDSFLGTGLTVSQNVSIGVLIAGIILLFYLRQKPKE